MVFFIFLLKNPVGGPNYVDIKGILYFAMFLLLSVTNQIMGSQLPDIF